MVIPLRSAASLSAVASGWDDPCDFAFAVSGEQGKEKGNEAKEEGGWEREREGDCAQEKEGASTAQPDEDGSSGRSFSFATPQEGGEHTALV